MRLFVYLLEGRGWAVTDSYVKLQVGKYKSKTRVLRGTETPIWNEEFAFRIVDLEDELVTSVYNCSGDGERPLLEGRVRVPVWTVAAEEKQNLPPTWFSVERVKNFRRSAEKDFGKLLLALSLYGDNTADQNSLHREGKFISFHDAPMARSRWTLEGKVLMKALAHRMEKFFSKREETPHNDSSSESSLPSDSEGCAEEMHSSLSFQDLIELLQSQSESREMPDDLHGGILLDETYVASIKDLNAVLCAPDSEFRRDLAEFQGIIDLQEEPWKWKSDGVLYLSRVVTYTKAATKLVKAIKATEEQTYLKASRNEFAILVIVSTPDVPYGSSFKVYLLYKMMLGSAGEESARLVVSWAVNFTQNSVMKGVIENGARQGLKESFEQFSSLLSHRFKVMQVADMSDKDNLLATLETGHQSDMKLAIQYFWNFTVASGIFVLLYFIIHIFLSEPSKLQGLELNGLNMPDSFGEIISSGLLFVQLGRVYKMISHFVEARLHRGSDHGVKAQGDGWVLTVALIEGSNLPSMNQNEIPDPYVVFTCNGKTRTSSVKLQTVNPQWSEILEFDAVEDPPSVLDVEIYDFDGPFDQACSLGHAEINFLKHTATELADLWILLDGKLARSSQSKLHLRIFLDNNNGVETIRDYLANLEKEVGKKLNIRSPHRNSTFQKVFGLPPEEFLISDFSCSLKRKMPLQGRFFLSARIVGFYTNLFGHKTRFFFLWEDIEDIQVLPPSLATVGSPSLVIILHKGRGLDARHGAKLLDDEGRLHFCFHSFVSFSAASRTIMALWRSRTLDPEQKAQIAEERMDEDGKPLLADDTGSYLVVKDVEMTKIYSVELPTNIKSLMKMFDGGDLEHEVMNKAGCLNYLTTAWENVAPDTQERRVCYKFSRRISILGGEVTCTQRKSPLPDHNGWEINEIMTLHDVPFSNHFQVQLRYRIEKSSFTQNCCKCDIYIGILWRRSTKFEGRITKNIIGRFGHRLKEILQFFEREILLMSQ